MRFTTLRTLMLVLAMVTQTFAGGFALARAAAISPEETLTAQCHQLRAGESSTPDDKTGRGHHCLSCLLCSEPPPAWVSVVNYQIVAPSDLALIETFTGAAPPQPFGRPSRAHSARAPPLSRA
ncbi:MAG: hypothetical protein U1E20_03280 [Methylocystis sp.]|uniref:hypothetical protein n=1 Tax=Methylocystis sp. TaxID=1911079 RepID=UPI003941F38B